MAVLKIVQWPSPVLTSKAVPVVEFDGAFQKFVQDMHETCRSEQGVGLAANQVGSLQRVFVVQIPYHEHDHHDHEEGHQCTPKQWWHNKAFTFVNPVIVKRQGRAKGWEGCLSFPDIYETIERDAKVTVEAFDETGKPFTVEADDLFAICIQHELDHLDGVVFTDRMSRLKAVRVRKTLERQMMATAGR